MNKPWKPEKGPAIRPYVDDGNFLCETCGELLHYNGDVKIESDEWPTPKECAEYVTQTRERGRQNMNGQ
jgi:hypothetical protein